MSLSERISSFFFRSWVCSVLSRAFYDYTDSLLWISDCLCCYSSDSFLGLMRKTPIKPTTKYTALMILNAFGRLLATSSGHLWVYLLFSIWSGFISCSSKKLKKNAPIPNPMIQTPEHNPTSISYPTFLVRYMFIAVFHGGHVAKTYGNAETDPVD